MRADRVVESQPVRPVVFYLDKDCCPAGPEVLMRCPHIQFFCGGDHAVHWQDAHVEYRDTLLDLPDAAAFATRHFAETILAVRSVVERV